MILYLYAMPTIIKENYLKALHFLNQNNAEISLTALGEAMGVSKPTVNNMVKNLKSNGWVVYEKYKPIKLTEKGKKAAALVIRKHRLSEMFLYKLMGFGWEEVHDMAEELEHIKSDLFFERMDELLGFPTIDPHGSPIPDKEGNFNKPNYPLLSQVAAGSQVVLRGLRDSSSEFLVYLDKKGLQLGTRIKLLHIEPFDKSVTIRFPSKEEITLSHSVSNRLLVEVTSDPS